MALETKFFTIEGYKSKDGNVAPVEYVFTKLSAIKGLDVQFKLRDDMVTPAFIKDVVCSSVAIGSVRISSDKFDEYFSGRYTHLMDVYNSVLEFNFDENFPDQGSVGE